MRRALVLFARRTGQSLREVIEWWHPSDLDTWLEQDLAEAEESHFAELREDHHEAHGRR